MKNSVLQAASRYINLHDMFPEIWRWYWAGGEVDRVWEQPADLDIQLKTINEFKKVSSLYVTFTNI